MNYETAGSPFIARQDRLPTEKFTPPFQPDSLLPAQYFDDCRGKTLEPEKNLMFAVLDDAIRCFQDNHSARCGGSKLLFDRARIWIFEVSTDWVFGFENICSVLGFDPAYIRTGLVRWREKKLANPPRESL
jgi:hypothetical protein